LKISPDSKVLLFCFAEERMVTLEENGIVTIWNCENSEILEKKEQFFEEEETPIEKTWLVGSDDSLGYFAFVQQVEKKFRIWFSSIKDSGHVIKCTCKITHLASIPRIIMGKSIVFEYKNNIESQWWIFFPEGGAIKSYTDKGLGSIHDFVKVYRKK